MNLIKVKITPHSSFVTFPKGDTLFGHFAYHTLLKENGEFMDIKESIFREYTNGVPKIIFSDILPENYLYKPSFPKKYFNIKDEDNKEFKKRSWISIENLQKGNFSLETLVDKFEIDKDTKVSFFKKEIRVRNALNRLSFTTDESGIFAPYSLEEITFLYQPVVYILYDSPLSENEILERLNQIGKNGFGKKGSIGKGYFSAKIDESFKGFENKGDYYLTLSPSLLHNQDNIKETFYNTFNRFGKHHTQNNPFKKALLLADSGAVVKLKESKQFIGNGINNSISQNSLQQGYSIIVPFKFRSKKCQQLD